MANFYLSKALRKMAGGKDIHLDLPQFIPSTCKFPPNSTLGNQVACVGNHTVVVVA